MDIKEGKQALQKINELEKQVEERLDKVRREAREIVSSAKQEAENMIQMREKKLSALHQSLTDFRSTGTIEPQNLGSSDAQIDQKLVKNLAKDFLKYLIK